MAVNSRYRLDAAIAAVITIVAVFTDSKATALNKIDMRCIGLYT